MKKSNEEDARVPRVHVLREGLRHEIEKYLVDHECSTTEVMCFMPMVLHDIFGNIAKIEGVSHDEVFGTFVKAFGAWNYLKTSKEG